jgi:hypothetical protein
LWVIFALLDQLTRDGIFKRLKSPGIDSMDRFRQTMYPGGTALSVNVLCNKKIFNNLSQFLVIQFLDLDPEHDADLDPHRNQFRSTTLTL